MQHPYLKTATSWKARTNPKAKVRMEQPHYGGKCFPSIAKSSAPPKAAKLDTWEGRSLPMLRTATVGSKATCIPLQPSQQTTGTHGTPAHSNEINSQDTTHNNIHHWRPAASMAASRAMVGDGRVDPPATATRSRYRRQV